ncbi:hypothetical protein V8F20_003383 [Naviculisporaceae sp. PSN 640]
MPLRGRVLSFTHPPSTGVVGLHGPPKQDGPHLVLHLGQNRPWVRLDEDSSTEYQGLVFDLSCPRTRSLSCSYLPALGINWLVVSSRCRVFQPPTRAMVIYPKSWEFNSGTRFDQEVEPRTGWRIFVVSWCRVERAPTNITDLNFDEKAKHLPFRPQLWVRSFNLSCPLWPSHQIPSMNPLGIINSTATIGVRHTHESMLEEIMVRRRVRLSFPLLHGLIMTLGKQPEPDIKIQLPLCHVLTLHTGISASLLLQTSACSCLLPQSQTDRLSASGEHDMTTSWFSRVPIAQCSDM